MEAYTCELYGQKECRNVNDARVRLFKLGKHDDLSLPPNQDSLQKHVERANFQAAIYKQCLIPNQEIGEPENNGWKMDEGKLAIHWMTLPPAPEGIMELVHCSCKKTKCAQNKCSCFSQELKCTDLCSCLDCFNTKPEIDTVIYDQEEDSEDSENE